jgi:hypothetical protein
LIGEDALNPGYNWEGNAMEKLRTELLRDHAAIETLSRRLSRLIDSEADPATLAEALSHLVQTVAGHLDVEEAILYSDVMEAQSSFTRADIEKATRDFERLKTNWRAYCLLWREEEIAADREGFVRATRAMLPRLGDRVRLETDLLVLAGALKPRPR